MLDVHAPEHTPHSWPDFFIHIATIVVGLLIAVGLEQSVEWLHHHNEVRETRRALAVERKLNRNNADARTKEFRLIMPILQRDLAIFNYLKIHPGASPDKWPGKLGWSRYTVSFDDSAWQTAQKSNAISYMSRNEIVDLTELYGRMKAGDDAADRFISAVSEATVFAVREPDASRLPPEDIEIEIRLLTRAIYQQAGYGNVLANFADHYPEFASPTRQEVAALRQVTSPKAEADATQQILIEHERVKAEILRESNE